MGSVFRKGSAQTGQSTGYSNILAREAIRLMREGTPLRQQAFGQLGNFLQSGRLPSAMTGAIGQQEQEMASARRAILNSGVRCGQLRTELAQLPLQRLQMRDALRSDVFNAALSAGLGSFSQGGNAMGMSAANLNSLGQGRIAQNQAAKSMLGGGAGALLSLLKKD